MAARVKGTGGLEWKAYEAARAGLTDTAIAKSIGVAWGTFKALREREKGFANAIEAGRRMREAKGVPLADHVLGLLPPECRSLWSRIGGTLEDSSPPAQAREEAVRLIAESPEGWQQRIFLQCLMKTNWIVGEAARRCGVPKWRIEQWLEDPAFAKLVEEVENAKDDFFEGCLVDLCRRGDSPAIIFANRSRNRKRGYGEKTEVSIDASMEVRHRIAVESLEEVPLEARQALLEAIRRRQAGEQAPLPQLPAPKTKEVPASIIDAEFTELPPLRSRRQGKVEILERAKR